MRGEYPEDRLSRLGALLRGRGHLTAAGLTHAGIRSAVARGEILRMLHGRYVSASDWDALDFEDRHLLLALAVDRGAERPPVFSHITAALILGLPLLRFTSADVHVLAANTASTSPRKRRELRGSGVPARPAIIRHRRDPTLERTETTGGLRHTDLVQTVIDVARTAPFDGGLVCADAGLRRLAREQGLDQEEARIRLLDRLARAPNVAGNPRARRVLAFASVLAESPLESLSRLQLARLGIMAREQVEVPGPGGRRLRLDFHLVDFDTFFEADGRSKYADAALRNGRTAEEVLLDEKLREDFVRGSTRQGVIRGGWSDARTPAALAALLRAFGVEPPNPDGFARPELY